MTTMHQRSRMRDRAGHIADTATDPVPLDPWMQPSKRAFAFCKGPCANGTRICYTPDACELGEPEPPTFWGSLVELVRFWK